MHAEMILIFFVTLMVAQFVLIEWKRRHYRSYSVSHISNTCRFMKCWVFLADNVIRNVVSTIGYMPPKSLVEVHIHVALVFVYHEFNSAKSVAETDKRNNTKIGVQMVSVPVQTQLCTWHNWLHHNDVSIFRLKFGVRRKSKHVDGLRVAFRLLRLVLRRFRSRHLRDLRR